MWLVTEVMLLVRKFLSVFGIPSTFILCTKTKVLRVCRKTHISLWFLISHPSSRCSKHATFAAYDHRSYSRYVHRVTVHHAVHSQADLLKPSLSHLFTTVLRMFINSSELQFLTSKAMNTVHLYHA